MRFVLVLFISLTLLSCSLNPSQQVVDEAFQQTLKSGFRAEGIATLARLAQDESNDWCSQVDLNERPDDPEISKKIEQNNLKTIVYPPSFSELGKWQEGEKIAQSGRGSTWTDKAETPSGGGCYNCHQISKQEIAYGTIGPSLYQYGKLRGINTRADLSSESGRAVVHYTWGKIWNSRAYNGCSKMPRFGHLLTTAQIQDVMALLLDPDSAVNQ